MQLKDIIKAEANNKNFKLESEVITIIDAIEHFNKTKEVKDILLTGFDQNGEWVRVWKNPYTKEHETKLQKIRLDEKRIFSFDKKDPTKKILNTSYIDHQKIPTLSLTYQHIKGRVELPKTKKFIAPFLTEVGGPISLNQCKHCDIPQLKTVKGFANLRSIENFFAPELQKIVGVLNLYFAQNVQCPKLRDVTAVRLESCPKRQIISLIKKLSIKSLIEFSKFESQTHYDSNPTSPNTKKGSLYFLLWQELNARKLKQKLREFSRSEDEIKV